jgi:hypothetical protein
MFALSTWESDGKRLLWGMFPTLDRLIIYMKEFKLFHVEIKKWECLPENLTSALCYYGLDKPDVIGPKIDELFNKEHS